MATMSSARITATTAVETGRNLTVQKRRRVNRLNSFVGLKPHNPIVSLVYTDQSFAKIVSSLKRTRRNKGGTGGALSIQCNAAAEIFKIAAIIPALVLVGVAVGFVLLRIEASVEESED